MKVNRRNFVQRLGALAAATGFGGKRAEAAPYSGAQTLQSAKTLDHDYTVHRKNFVGIQVKPFAWMDEGIDRLLDTVQNTGNVNTVFVYTFDGDPNRTVEGGAIPLPDHGKYGSGKPRMGGAFYDYDQKYFRGTTLKDFRSNDEPNFNVITAVA